MGRDSTYYKCFQELNFLVNKQHTSNAPRLPTALSRLARQPWELLPQENRLPTFKIPQDEAYFA